MFGSFWECGRRFFVIWQSPSAPGQATSVQRTNEDLCDPWWALRDPFTLKFQVENAVPYQWSHGQIELHCHIVQASNSYHDISSIIIYNYTYIIYILYIHILTWKSMEWRWNQASVWDLLAPGSRWLSQWRGSAEGRGSSQHQTWQSQLKRQKNLRILAENPTIFRDLGGVYIYIYFIPWYSIL